MGLPIYLSWVFETWIGAEFGRLIEEPEAIGIDFMITIYFFGMVLGLRKRPLWLPIVAASAFASVFAYRTIGSPWHVSIGALAGIGIALLPWPGNRPRSLDDPV
jgi:predicted branched-subunit amino acid permease